MNSDKVVVKRREFIPGAPMEKRQGVRDWKVIYPELVPGVRTLCLGIVEVDPGCSTPLHSHNCEEVYYILEGVGEVEVDGVRHPVEAGDGVYLREGVKHRMINRGETSLRWVDVGGIMFTSLWPRWPTESPYVFYPEAERP